MTQTHLFYLFACGVLLGAVGVISCRRVYACVLSFLLSVFMLGGLLFLLKSFFPAALIMSLGAGTALAYFFFARRFANPKDASIDPEPRQSRGWMLFLSLAAGILFFLLFLKIIPHIGPEGPIQVFGCCPPWWKNLVPEFQGTARVIGQTLLGRYLLPSGLLAFAILAAIIGTVTLTKKERP
jgi:NADH:ubiquinone oxidoreductase subunit 6 (subunit J)